MKNTGEGIDVIIGKLAEANELKGIIDIAYFNRCMGTMLEEIAKIVSAENRK